jgi:hypothetical protein
MEKHHKEKAKKSPCIKMNFWCGEIPNSKKNGEEKKFQLKPPMKPFKIS